MANKLEAFSPELEAFLHWRSTFPWAKFYPYNADDLSDIPDCILHYTARVESKTWKKADPEMGYWILEDYLRRRKERRARGIPEPVKDGAEVKAKEKGISWDEYIPQGDWYYHQLFGYDTGTGTSTTASHEEESQPSTTTQVNREGNPSATRTPLFNYDFASLFEAGSPSHRNPFANHPTQAPPSPPPPPPPRSRSSHPTATTTAQPPPPQASSSSHPTTTTTAQPQPPHRSASKAHFHELESKGIWQAGDTLHVPLYSDQGRRTQQGFGILRYIGPTPNSSHATDWDFSANNGNGPVSRIGAINGPTDFVVAFENLGLVGPKGAWSSRVRVVRGGLDLGTVTEFKARNQVDAAVGARGS